MVIRNFTNTSDMGVEEERNHCIQMCVNDCQCYVASWMGKDGQNETTCLHFKPPPNAEPTPSPKQSKLCPAKQVGRCSRATDCSASYKLQRNSATTGILCVMNETSGQCGNGLRSKRTTCDVPPCPSNKVTRC